MLLSKVFAILTLPWFSTEPLQTIKPIRAISSMLLPQFQVPTVQRKAAPATEQLQTPASPYGLIHHVSRPRNDELLPAPQILEPPARFLPAVTVSRTGRQSDVQPSYIPRPMPLIPIDQIPKLP
jgi:hypothetical protein